MGKKVSWLHFDAFWTVLSKSTKLVFIIIHVLFFLHLLEAGITAWIMHAFWLPHPPQNQCLCSAFMYSSDTQFYRYLERAGALHHSRLWRYSYSNIPSAQYDEIESQSLFFPEYTIPSKLSFAATYTLL